MLECQNTHYYLGYTTDLKRRYQEHQQGSSKCKYTRSFPPVKMAAWWTVKNLSDALKLERRLKKLSKEQKKQLVSLSLIDIYKLVGNIAPSNKPKGNSIMKKTKSPTLARAETKVKKLVEQLKSAKDRLKSLKLTPKAKKSPTKKKRVKSVSKKTRRVKK